MICEGGVLATVVGCLAWLLDRSCLTLVPEVVVAVVGGVVCTGVVVLWTWMERLFVFALVG